MLDDEDCVERIQREEEGLAQEFSKRNYVDERETVGSGYSGTRAGVNELLPQAAK